MKNLIQGLAKSTKVFSGNTLSKCLMLAMLSITVITSSCKKEPDDEGNNKPNTPKSTAIYVLNQGTFSHNNASVTMYNMENDSITEDYFMSQNERALGDTGADLFIYGGKAYIVTNVSSQLEIVNSVTFKSIKQIPFIKDEVPQQPSAVTGYQGNVYVAAYDGTVTVIDTALLEIVKVIEVGSNPDAILAASGKIWVSNSGGLNFPNYDNTVSIIDPVTLTETDRFEVGTNPYTLQSDSYGDIYVVTRGNYGDEKMRLRIIDPVTKSVKYTFEEIEVYNFTIKGDTAYVYYYDFTNLASNIMTINVKTEEVISTSFITDGTQIETVYGIAADPTTGDVYICDAKNYDGLGKVYRFGKDGKLKSSFNAGVNPVAVRFLIR